MFLVLFIFIGKKKGHLAQTEAVCASAVDMSLKLLLILMHFIMMPKSSNSHKMKVKHCNYYIIQFRLFLLKRT